jgi:hypothetical protein
LGRSRPGAGGRLRARRSDLVWEPLLGSASLHVAVTMTALGIVAYDLEDGDVGSGAAGTAECSIEKLKCSFGVGFKIEAVFQVALADGQPPPAAMPWPEASAIKRRDGRREAG